MKLKRTLKHLHQRLTRGWSDEQTWGLCGTIAEFVLPRLIRFRDLNNGHPIGMTEKKWNEYLNDMIYAMETVNRERTEPISSDDADWDRVDRGLRYFGKYFRDLWW